MHTSRKTQQNSFGRATVIRIRKIIKEKLHQNLLRFVVLAILAISFFLPLLFSFLKQPLFKTINFPLCLFHTITGHPCPGCGMTRAFLSLGQFEIKRAFQYNPFSIPLFSLMIYYLFLGKTPEFLKNKTFLVFINIIIFIYWINIL